MNTTNLITTEPFSMDLLQEAVQKMKDSIPEKKENPFVYKFPIYETRMLEKIEGKPQYAIVSDYGIVLPKRFKNISKQIIFPISKKKRIRKKFSKNPDNYITIKKEFSMLNYIVA